MKSCLHPIPGYFLFLLVLLTACIAAPAWASEQIVTLTDGSSIRGEVVGMHDGKYSIETASLGRVEVDTARVASIVAAAAAPAQAAPGALLPQSAGDAVQQVQSALASNPSLMSEILRLQSDPDMQAALKDPDIMRAVQSFDLDALMKNPKFQALLNNPRIKEIQSDIH